MWAQGLALLFQSWGKLWQPKEERDRKREGRERVKYHFKEEVKAQACESITRGTIYAQARVRFDMGIMKKRRSLWMT